MNIALLVGLIVVGVLAPLTTCLAIWWSANWERVRMAEAMPAADEAAERLP
jgi:hypothetical protein